MKIALAILLVGAVTLLASCSKSTPLKPADVDHYTCTMHPSVRAEVPGTCPICGMELVPVKRETAPPTSDNKKSSRNRTFVVPVERQQQIGVTYATVVRKPLDKTIRGVGTVEADQQRHWAFVARVDGFVQQLFVASAGQVVEKDQALLSIYSPDLLTTERELVMLLRMRDEARTPDARGTPERLISAAKMRLQQWNITPEQVAELEKTRTPTDTITLHSPFRGVVQELPAHQGVQVKVGDHLADVADLSTIWVWADFYETEIGSLQEGQIISVGSKSFQGEKFEGKIAVVDPFVDPIKRTSRVRIDIPNPDFKLRPGMYADVVVAVRGPEQLSIPASAIMPTGGRNIAFVDKGNGRIEPRDVKLGGQYGDAYAIAEGLTEGERVVASANFLIDAEAKVQGALADFYQRQE